MSRVAQTIRIRAVLLACSAAVVAASANARATPPNRTDLGPLDPATQISATIWLKPANEAAFDAAVSARMNPASPLYHHWMSPAEVASYSQGTQQINELSAALQAAGVEVTGREADGAALHVSAAASVMSRAFATQFHAVAIAGRPAHVNLSEPHFAGAGAELIAGVTGFSNVPMQPLVRRQIDPATFRPATPVPVAGVLNPYTIFTDNCFQAAQRTTLVQFVPGGNSIDEVASGPKYTTRNLPKKPFKNCGYTPAELATHYGLPAVYARGLRGAGQTIVIVDAYGSPTITSDANTFSTLMGLPALGAANFQVIYPDGPPAASPYTTDWPLEVALDVEWAHAIAPAAKIVLVVAPSDADAELAFAMNYAASHHLGDVMSNSFGESEAATGPEVARAYNAVIRRAAAQGIAVNVASGDDGDFGLGTPVGAASIPADSPFATAVGGTSLGVPSDNGPVDSVWGIDATFLGALNEVAAPPTLGGFVQGSGGGQSLVLEKPLWQARAGLPGVGRRLPDVSMIADPQTGGIIVADNGSGTAAVLTTVGGTSLATPVFSAVWALAQQAAAGPLGQAGPVVANMLAAALTDIVPVQATVSNLSARITQAGSTTSYTPAELLGLTATQPNGFVGVLAIVSGGGPYEVLDLGFGADSSLMTAPGWDTATGWGEPNGLAFIEAAKAAK